MPELVEVTDMTQKIKRKFKNKKIKSVHIISGRYKKSKPKLFNAFSRALKNFNGLKILNISNKGKFVWIQLDHNWSIWITLGLTGSLDPFPTNHARVVFKTTGRDDIFFNDTRNFGTIIFNNKNLSLQRKLNSLGPNPINTPKQWSFNTFAHQLSRLNQNQKVSIAIVNQKIISGIGNILRAEILYHAKINPNCKLKDINLKPLFKSINWITKNYYSQFKRKGFYDVKVYRQSTDLKGNPVKSIIDKHNRKVWWVPAVQRYCT